MSADRYSSVPERIAWTPGFRVATDKALLGTLSTFADFKTGRHAVMALATLIQRARMPRRTVIRSLRRLEADGWVTACRRHRRPTVYHICIERLATHWMEAKLVSAPTGLSATGGTQEADFLSATGDRLSATGGTQEAVLSATGGTPSPVRTDPQFDPQTPALRADLGQTPNSTTTTTEDKAKVERPHQLALGPYDVKPGPRLTGPPPSAGDDIWTALLRRIEVKVNRHSFHTWFRDTTLVQDGGAVIYACGSAVNGELHVAWIQKHYADVLQQAIDEVRPGARIAFVAATERQRKHG